MNRKKNVYDQAKREAQRYKNAKAGKKGRAAILAIVAMILAAIGVSQREIGKMEQAVENVLDAYDSSAESKTSVSETKTDQLETKAETEVETKPETKTETAQDDTSVVQAASGAQVQVDLAAIPVYSGEPYTIINGNVPYFSEEDLQLASESFEYYSELDDLGRCGTAYSSVGTDLMPTQKRGSISQVKPTGWQVSKYDFVDGKYLYNRCHLIGYQLTAENANKKNLITGTRYLNVVGMLPFENLVADYVKETKNHVLYRVTPVFDGENLVADGVLMEAESVEDTGDGVEYCVYVYNVQPGVVIDYATGENHAEN